MLKSKFKIEKGLIIQKLNDQTVIFDADQSVLYTLNETAAFIFSRLKRGQDKEKIIQSLCRSYQVEEKKAAKDYDQLIEDLLKKKIIKKTS